ncbi:hypothetical protein FHS18_000580 [Paenibacillus phyllosphaerae]|uniref:Copper amine oxidase-like N-terminal domain-containing protein n=1 Tax=Paenibacillus phyllosphaerae TaxID=274593 RepID=A0A7W5FL26_9BACL|nr:copper amine oxidase N-terminal domain-containing protein [Paenibacillus phyllosphaerae]MBB3108552.1 hypothetical protein [Paenibacillus phyllosphaerae]
MLKKSFFSKFLTSMLLIVMLVSALSSAAFAAQANPIRVWLDGTEIKFDVTPTVKDNSVYVQFKQLFQKLGYSINFVNETKTLTAVSADKKVNITLKTTGATVNGKAFSNAKALFAEGRVLVPLRFVGETAGLKVVWDAKARAVQLTAIPQEPTEPALSNETLATTFTDELFKALNTNNAEAYLALYDPKMENYEMTKAAITYYLPTSAKVDNAYSDLKIISATDSEIKFSYTMTMKKPEGSTDFYIDREYKVQSTITKNSEGKWLLTARTTSDQKLLNEQPFVEQANVAEADKKAVLAVVENNIKAQNQENVDALAATWDQNSPYFNLFKENYTKRFKNLEVTTTLEKAVLVSYTDELAYVYAEIKTETKLVNSTFKDNRISTVIRLTKGANGQWVADPSNDTLKYQEI